MEEALQIFAQEWRATFDAIVDVVCLMDLEGRIQRCNIAMTKLLEKPFSEIIGRNCWELICGASTPIEGCPMVRMRKTKRREAVVLPIGNRWVNVTVDPVLDEAGKLIGGIHILRDITERKQAEEQVKVSLKEKEVLLKEIHHRVKNNLQVIFSLLNLQSRYIKDKQMLEMFKESQNRIKSMTLIHEKLYQSKDLSRIDFAEYIKALAADLFRSYGVSSKAITLKINVEDVLLSIDTAIPCGLIINELVSNSLKHAFPAGKACSEGSESKGEIRIGLYSHDDMLTLIVSNNGIGFPKDLDFQNIASLGLRLVSTLTNQIGGTLELDSSGGTTFRITFTEQKYSTEKR